MQKQELKEMLNEINRLIELEQKRIEFGRNKDRNVLETLKSNRRIITVLFIRSLIKEEE